MVERTNTAEWMAKEGRWRIRVQRDGKRRAFYSSTPGRTGQREANARADAWLQSGAANDGKTRVADIVPEFLEALAKTSLPSSMGQPTTICKCWILPHIGRKKIDRVTDYDVQNMVNTAYQKGLSKKTLKNIKSVTNRLFKYARKRKISTYIPEDISIPKAARNNGKKVLQPQDLQLLFSRTQFVLGGKVQDCPYVNAFRFQVATGLRPGELKGLQWDDIDGARVYIRRAVNEAKEVTRGKNESAIRSFIMSPLARQVLEAQPHTGKYVFGISTTSNAYRKYWRLFCAHNGIDYVTPYELRHTFVSIVKGLPLGVIQPVVGHVKDFDTIGTYSHALNGDDAKTAQLVAAEFEKVFRLVGP